MNHETNWDVTLRAQSQHRESDKNCTTGCLVRIHPLELENKLVQLEQQTITIGRDNSCNVFCNNSSVSRLHAKIFKTDQGIFVEDCDSTNGTFVDGQSVKRVKLLDGNQLQVGNHIFKFIGGNSIESQYHETVYKMMTKDGLTGTYNKRYFIDTLNREFERSQRYGSPFSLIMMDIDYFKLINDTYGHLTGDEVLKEFAIRIQSVCCGNEVFARFGGEEFACMLIETDLEAATEFAELLKLQISTDPFVGCAGEISVQASFGVSQFDPVRHFNIADVLDGADQQLYLAKNQGRNRVCSDYVTTEKPTLES